MRKKTYTSRDLARVPSSCYRSLVDYKTARQVLARITDDIAPVLETTFNPTREDLLSLVDWGTGEERGSSFSIDDYDLIEAPVSPPGPWELLYANGNESLVFER